VTFHVAPDQAATVLPAARRHGHAPRLFDQPGGSDASEAARLPQSGASAQTPAPPFDYSDGYRTRAKIHKIASFATLPLFATQLFLGQSLYENSTSGKKTAHIVVGSSIGVLFGVNTVTGVWNMWESRNEPSHHKLKLIHGILMLGADAGFVATFASGPGGRNNTNLEAEKQTHRTIALTSIGVATASYLIMLFGNK
jgi:hypothetical protein